MKKWIPHVIVLLLLSIAEAARLFEFFLVLTGNQIAGITSAIITVAIVFYLAFYGYLWASRWATALCIILSLASFVQPLRTEYKKDQERIPTVELKAIPEWNPRLFWNGGKDSYKRAYDLQVDAIREQNEKIMIDNQIIRKDRELSLYFWHLLLGALVLGVCVPILNYLVSHKISSLNARKTYDVNLPWAKGTKTWETKEPEEDPVSDLKIFAKAHGVEIMTAESKPQSEFSSPTARPPRIPKKRKFEDSGPSLPFPFMEGFVLA